MSFCEILLVYAFIMFNLTFGGMMCLLRPWYSVDETRFGQKRGGGDMAIRQFCCDQPSRTL